VSDTFPVPVNWVGGIDDRFAETDPYDELLDRYGMSVQDMVSVAQQMMAAKSDGGHA